MGIGRMGRGRQKWIEGGKRKMENEKNIQARAEESFWLIWRECYTEASVGCDNRFFTKIKN